MTRFGVLVGSCVLTDPIFCQATCRAWASGPINQDCGKRRGLLLCRRNNQGWGRSQERGVELEAMYGRVF